MKVMKVHLFIYLWLIIFDSQYAKLKLDGMYNVHCTHESERERKKNIQFTEIYPFLTFNLS